MYRLFLFFLLTLLTCSGYGQNKYIKSSSIGTVKKKAPENKKLHGPVNFRELSEMIGEQFVVMPKGKHIQSYGYQHLYKASASSMTDNLSYKEGLGMVLKLVEFDGVHGVFQDSLGNRFRSTAYSQQFADMAPIRDLEEAEKLFLHKFLWVKDFNLSTFDEKTQETGEVPNVRLTRVSVEGIQLGTEENQPVRFILKTTGGKYGFLDVNISGSNLGYKYRDFYSFNNTFWTYNPKLKYKYSPAIWKLIAGRDVAIGMTAQQVKLSLGEPDKVNYSEYASGSHEQWIYGEDSSRSFYYFTNGRLTAQN